MNTAEISLSNKDNKNPSEGNSTMTTSFNIYAYTQHELTKKTFPSKEEALAYGQSLDDPRWFLVEEPTSKTRDFLVIWRGDEDDYMQSKVTLPALLDVRQMTNNDWVSDAARSEGYTESQVEALLESGYSLLLACDFPSEFFDD